MRSAAQHDSPASSSWLARAAASVPDGAEMECIALVVSVLQRGGWSRIDMVPTGGKAGDKFAAVTTSAILHPSNVYRVRGVYSAHPTYGPQLKISAAELVRPASVEGIREFLERMPGLGPIRTAKLVGALGDRTLDVLDGDPEAATAALTAIPGITPAAATTILHAYGATASVARVHSKLAGFGLTANQIAKLASHYGDAGALRIVERAPYAIIGAVPSFGFLTVDGLARRAGIAENAAERLDAAIHYALEEAAGGEGHTTIEPAACTQWIAKKLRVSAPDIAARVEAFTAGRIELAGITSTPEGLALQRLDMAERAVAGHVRACRTAGPVRAEGLPLALPDTLTAGQRSAVEGLLHARIGVLTGGPGTGKTYTLRTLLSAWHAMGRRTALAAPTGKAAIRMTEATRSPAQTVHRLLEYGRDGFARDADNPIPADVVVVDESSMLDAELAAALTSAVDTDATQLILVGDVDQLPSVGPGAVLRDLIAARVPTHRLTEIKRQGEGSTIVRNAAAILRGEMPSLEAAEDWRFVRKLDAAGSEIPDPSAEEIASAIVAQVCRAIPERYGIPSSQIQVLCPQRTGAAGVEALNEALRARLNPGQGRGLRQHDRVMQTANDYTRNVFNGETGTVTTASPSGCVVDFGGRVVEYDQEGAQYLRLAYAMTIHKSQGSEFPAVVIPLHKSHTFMLRRQLVYTAITRAQRLCVLVGTTEACKRAVRNAEEFKRTTRLRALCSEVQS